MVDPKAALCVFTGSLKLKKHESCLVVTDTLKKELAEAFVKQASGISENVSLKVIEPSLEHGTEPPEEIAELMKLYDVQLLITSSSLTHTKARREATLAGARIATMPGITEETINRCLDIDYENLKNVSEKLFRRLSETTRVKVTSEEGTDLEMGIGGSSVFGRNGGLLDYPGAYGNLPEGELAFAPSGVRGRFVVDGTFPGLGLLKAPVFFDVENDFVVSISGFYAQRIKKRLDRFAPKSYKVAELGIGLNPKAKMTGNILEDEKVIGTAHIALGNNMSFGGDNDVPIHLDGVMCAPTIFFDGEPVMISGKFERAEI